MNGIISFFQDIDRMHSQWSMMDKLARIAYLKAHWNKLNQMAYQYGIYLQGRSNITLQERKYARQLIEMIKSVEAKGMQTQREFEKEWFLELLKSEMR